MKLRRSTPRWVRMLQAAAAGAGTVRLAFRQRTVRPRRPPDQKKLTQLLRRG